MHQATVTNWSQNGRKGNLCAQHPCSQVAFTNGYGLARSEGDRFECAAVLDKGYFRFGTTIQVIENGFWQTPFRQTPKIIDIHDPWRGYFATWCDH
jgi:hypothetical protein